MCHFKITIRSYYIRGGRLMTVSLMVGLVAVPLCHHYLFFQKKIDETPLSSLRQISQSLLVVRCFHEFMWLKVIYFGRYIYFLLIEFLCITGCRMFVRNILLCVIIHVFSGMLYIFLNFSCCVYKYVVAYRF